MDNRYRPAGKDIPVRSQPASNAHKPAFAERENPNDDPCHSNDDVVIKTLNEPVHVFAVDKQVLESAAVGLTQEASVWDVYNNEARKVDDELVKDWRDNLGSLLLFAAIFAAVLTAFIIESKKMLEQDQAELLVHATIFGINNMGNTSNLPFVPPAFVPTPISISINCFLFSSLGASLMAALATVVSLQWVAAYDAAITRGGSSPEDRAKRRQFRFAGTLSWKMDGIIASLPLLLYSSVLLFWVGAVQWMYMLHPTVGHIVAGGMVMAVLFYVSTTLIGAVCVSAPFKTPLSRGVYWAYHTALYLVRELLSPIFEKGWFPVMPNIRFSARFVAVATARFIVLAITLPVRIPFVALLITVPWLDRHNHLDTAKRSLPQWIEAINQAFERARSWSTSHRTRVTSRQREDRAAAEDLSLTQQALAWLADQITSSANSSIRLQLLVDEVVKQFSKAGSLSSQSTVSQVAESMSAGSPKSNQAMPRDIFTDTSWLKIFDSLGWHYLRKILDGTLSESDHGTVGFLVERSRTLGVWEILSKHGSHNNSIQTNQWNQYSFGSTKVAKSQAMESVNMAFLLARDVPIPSPRSDHELRFTIRLIKWRNSGVREKEYPHSGHYSAEYLQSYVLYLTQFLHVADRKHYDLDDYIPLWSLAKDEELRHGLMVELLENFDELLVKDPSTMEDSCLFGIIIKDIARSHNCWPSSLELSEDHRQRLAKIRDPCLALLGNLTAGAPIHHVNALSMDKYAPLLDPSLFQSLSSGDPPVLWRLRALLWSALPQSRKCLCDLAFKTPEYISHLQRIFEHPVSCDGHSSGPQHLLYHLCVEPRRFASFPEQITFVVDDSFKQRWAYFILAVLALNKDQPLSSIKPMREDEIPVECIERIGTLCQAAKEEPTSILVLLTDIARSSSFETYFATNVEAILESIQNTLSTADQGSIAHLLLPLVDALRDLNRNMLMEERVDVTEPKRQMIATRADEICGILETMAAAPVVRSPSQLHLISCARACATGQPAVGWMAVYAEM